MQAQHKINHLTRAISDVCQMTALGCLERHSSSPARNFYSFSFFSVTSRNEPFYETLCTMRKIVLLSLFISVFSCSDTEELCTLTPSLTTDAPSNLTATSATFLGSIEAPTCNPLTISQGFVYGTNAQPNVNDQFVEVDGEAISTKISGLSQNQTYHCRTYLTDQVGTYCGNESYF